MFSERPARCAAFDTKALFRDKLCSKLYVLENTIEIGSGLKIPIGLDVQVVFGALGRPLSKMCCAK